MLMHIAQRYEPNSKRAGGLQAIAYCGIKYPTSYDELILHTKHTSLHNCEECVLLHFQKLAEEQDNGNVHHTR